MSASSKASLRVGIRLELAITPPVPLRIRPTIVPTTHKRPLIDEPLIIRAPRYPILSFARHEAARVLINLEYPTRKRVRSLFLKGVPKGIAECFIYCRGS